MKNLILILTVLSLTGCAGGFKSYYALQDECEAGNVQSCKDFQSRNRVVGTMAAGLDGYNQQQVIQAATQPAVQAPVTTRCRESALGGSFTCTTE